MLVAPLCSECIMMYLIVTGKLDKALYFAY